MNAVIGHTIYMHYPQVKQVLVRNYDPAMREMLDKHLVQIVAHGLGRGTFAGIAD